MIGLTHTTDYIIMLLVAAGLGAIGGLGAELLLNRGDNTGTIQLPSRLGGTDLVELGFPASLIIGAIAAVAILYFFPPVSETVIPGANGATAKTTNQYDLVKLIALSLIVGSAGPAFLSTAQSRLMSALNAQKTGTAVDTGKNQVQQVALSATAAVPGAVQEAVAQHIPGATPEQLKAVAETTAASLSSMLQPQVRVALEQVDAIGQKVQSEDKATADDPTEPDKK